VWIPGAPALFQRASRAARATKQEYVDLLVGVSERCRPIEVLVESVASQEYLAQDLERHMPIRRVERTKDKVSRAYQLQAFFENGQILFPAKPLQGDLDIYQALESELILFPSAEHDDLFDALQTAVEAAVETGSGVVLWAAWL
jgi:predicted phage terminase large subunit-like protein